MNNYILNKDIAIATMSNCGAGNALKGFISFLSINENTKMLYNNEYMLGDYQNVFDSSHILDEKDSKDYIKLYSWRFLILKKEESIQQHLANEITEFDLIHNINKHFDLFSTTTSIDSYYNRNLICDTVFERIMKGINRICWNQQITTELNKLLVNITVPILGISVRTWDASHEKNIFNYRSFNINDYKKAIDKVIINKNINSIFISYDNHKVEPQFLEYLKDYNIITYNKPDHITQLQYAVIKMLLLSKCNYFICNRISTFSELVFWFSGCKQEVIDI
jgi:hypothetical protein